MASPNMNMRDPTIYRIKRDADHPMTGAAEHTPRQLHLRLHALTPSTHE